MRSFDTIVDIVELIALLLAIVGLGMLLVVWILKMLN